MRPEIELRHLWYFLAVAEELSFSRAAVRVRMREIFPPDHVEALRAGTIDVAFVREPDSVDGIAALPVLVEPFVAAVPAAHPLAARRSIAVRALRDEPFVLFPRQSAPGVFARVHKLFRD